MLVVEVVVGEIRVIYASKMFVVLVMVIVRMETRPNILFLMEISFRDFGLVKSGLQDARCGRCRAIESNAARLYGKTSALDQLAGIFSSRPSPVPLPTNHLDAAKLTAWKILALDNVS